MLAISVQAPEGISLILNTKATASQKQKFRFTFYLSNVETFTTESTALTIQQANIRRQTDKTS